LIEHGQRPEPCFPCPAFRRTSAPGHTARSFQDRHGDLSRPGISLPGQHGAGLSCPQLPGPARGPACGALAQGSRGGRFAPVAVAVVVAAVSAMCVATRTVNCRSRARPRGCSTAADRHGVGPSLTRYLAGKYRESRRIGRDGVALCGCVSWEWQRCAKLFGKQRVDWDSGKLHPWRGEFLTHQTTCVSVTLKKTMSEIF
jgi:hypothetical protein